MSTLELNLVFAPMAEQMPAKISLKRQRFLLRRARLQRKANLKKKMMGAPAQEGRPHPTRPPGQGSLSASCATKVACPGFGNGLPAGKGSHPAGRGSHQAGCRNSKAWQFTPPSSSSTSSHRPPAARPAAPPPASALLLSECQSALPPLGAAPLRPTRGGPPPRLLPLPYPSSEGKLAPCAPQKPYKCVALDCEMVGTKGAGKRSELARCSIVGYHGDLIYDKYILPLNPITDYRTRWSGIRWHHMKNATPFKQAQKEILKILSGKIVIGHAIHNDFKALKYFHPQLMTRDTSKIPALNKKAGFSEKDTVSLKRLTKALLHQDIQMGRQGHSSVEDARATMGLYRLVEAQLEPEQVAESTQK